MTRCSNTLTHEEALNLFLDASLFPDAHWTTEEGQLNNGLRPASAGDINGDGRDDLAVVAVANSSTIYILTEFIP